MREEQKLKREISFLGLVAMSVGLNIGGALFVLSNVAGNLTGPSLPLAMFVSAVPVMLALIPISVLTSAWPTTSGSYRYAQLLNPTLAYVSMLTVGFCVIFGGQPLYALTAGIFLNNLVPVSPLLVGVSVLTIFFLINLLGIRVTARIQTLLFFVLISALVLFIILGIGQVDGGNFDRFFAGGVVGFVGSVGVLYTFCAGGLFVIDVGGEAIRAEKNFPKALLLGISIVVILSILIHFITVGTLHWSTMENTTLFDVAALFMKPAALSYFIIGGALVACVTTVNILFTIIPRSLLVMASEGLLPAFIGKVSARFGTPYWALTVTYGVSLVALLTIPSLRFFASMLNLGLIFAISVACITAAGLPKRNPDLFQKSAIRITAGRLKWVCSIVVAMNSIIFIFLGVAVQFAALVFIALLLGFYLLSFSRRQALQQIRQAQVERSRSAWPA